MEDEAFLDAVEYQLMEGGARWVAEFPESIRKVRAADVDFDMMVKGSTRGRSGYFLSAFAARVTLPDYSVACLVKLSPKSWDEAGVRDVLEATRRVLKKYDLQWCWVVLGQRGPPSRAVVRTVQGVQEKEIGVTLVNLNDNQAVRSSNLLGRNVHRVLPHGRRGAISKGLGLRSKPTRGVQVPRLVGIFGGALVVFVLATAVGLFFATGRFSISAYYFLGDMAFAAAVAFVVQQRYLFTDFTFDERGFRLVQGSDRRVQAAWRDYDLVSLYHMGGGRYHLTLYLRGDHDKYVDIPATTVKLDPRTLRRQVMEFTAHGVGRYPGL